MEPFDIDRIVGFAGLAGALLAGLAWLWAERAEARRRRRRNIRARLGLRLDSR